MKLTTHTTAINHLLHANQKLHTKLFRKKLVAFLTAIDHEDGNELKWFRRVPDAFEFNVSNKKVSVYEVVVSSAPDLQKLWEYASLWLHLDGCSAHLEMFWVTPFGTVAAHFTDDQLCTMFYSLERLIKTKTDLSKVDPLSVLVNLNKRNLQ